MPPLNETLLDQGTGRLDEFSVVHMQRKGLDVTSASYSFTSRRQ